MAEPHEQPEHLPEPLPQEPLQLLAVWLAQAAQRAQQPNPNAMVLATADPTGAPSARVVLCKGLDPAAGYLTFFTNYDSRKGRELAANPRAAAVFHWDALHRQARIEGRIEHSPASDSDRYFASRAWESRIGAWASAQSEPISSRVALHEAVARTAARFGTPVPRDEHTPDPGMIIARPPHWGGYRLWADAVELWVEGAGRVHDRARWSRALTLRDGQVAPGPWTVARLQP